MADIKKLIEERGALDHKIRSIVDGAEKDNRNLNAEEKKTFDECHTRDMELKERIDRAELLAKREAEMSEIRSHGIDRSSVPASAAGSPKSKREKITAEESALALEAWTRSQLGLSLSKRHKEACEKYRAQVDGKFNPKSRGMDFELSKDRQFRKMQQESRAFGLTEGATLRPEGFVNSLERALLHFGPMLQVADVLTTTEGNPLPWPTANDTGNEGVLLSEATTIGSSVEPTVSAMTLGAFKFSSKPILASAEILEDSAFDLANVFGEMLGERLGRIINRKFTVGVGTTEPTGIVTAATLGVTAASASAITGDELIRLQHSVDVAYRSNAAWMMHDSTISIIRRLKSNDNQYLFQPGLQLGVPDRLLGGIVHTNNHMDGIADAAETFNDASEKVVLYGQLSKYKARRVRGIRLRRLVERYADTDQECFVAFARVDGNLLDAGTHPVKYLKMGL